MEGGATKMDIFTDTCVVTDNGWAIVEWNDYIGWVSYGEDINNTDNCTTERIGHFVNSYDEFETVDDVAALLARLAD
jgi:hypothetical protein